MVFKKLRYGFQFVIKFILRLQDEVTDRFVSPIVRHLTRISSDVVATSKVRIEHSLKMIPEGPFKRLHARTTSDHSTLKSQPDQYSCKLGSGKYFALCGLGGILSCGTTHTALVPLDLVKCRIQVNPAKYKGIVNGFRVSIAEEGMRSLVKGWAPTLFGYSFQGLGKFGLYEVFKVVYGNAIGEEASYRWRTTLYLCASASAEFFADIALAPFEATKVRIQTAPNFASTMRAGMPIIYKGEGLMGFYKGIVPLWFRQIPYTMMKFACFERTIEALYKYVVPKPKEECSKPVQLTVTFTAGYIAGIFCAIVSHPADTVVSKLNNEKGLGAGEALKRLGFLGVWKGLTPRIIMIGTLTAAQWFIYDGVKVALKMPRPPPPVAPGSSTKPEEKAPLVVH